MPPAQIPTGTDSTYYTNDSRVTACLKRLQKAFGSNYEQLIVSDLLDAGGNQYVDLVQKGGGVLGIALVGYTFILEQVGIRFVRLAGTSAGAINTALMVVIGKKEDAKSVQILKYLGALQFFNLVDGHPMARKLIEWFIKDTEFSVKVKKLTGIIAVVLTALLCGDFLCLGFQARTPQLQWAGLLLFIVTGFFLLSLFVLIAYIINLLQRLKESGLGINPGNFFFTWMKDRMHDNDVDTVSEMNRKARDLPAFHLRQGISHPKNTNGIEGKVTFIASELVTENKFMFPEMCNLFRLEADIDELHPAGFVRASMAIPIFFESYYINNIPCTNDNIKERWNAVFNETDPPETVRFVDGGILSNFPIDIFYDPTISVPRFPVFGIDLDDVEPEDKTKHAMSWSIPGYLGRIFNTIRNYSDKNFLLKNKMFKKGIGKVKLSPKKYNWLNFFLSPAKKKALFVAGVEAATDFLLGNEKANILAFDWNEYKKDREKYHEILQKS